MQDRYIYQILTLLILSVTSQAFVINYRPFYANLENAIELINEVLNSIYLYNLLSLTEFSSKQSIEVRNVQGWILVSLCMITVLINFCLMVKEKYRSLKKFIILCRHENRLALRKSAYVTNNTSRLNLQNTTTYKNS